MPKKAIVSIGSNLGDRKLMLQRTLERIARSCKVLKISDVYETKSRYDVTTDPYLNCCVEFETEMDCHRLMEFLTETERQILGSGQKSGYKHCTIDCDLISYEDTVLRTPKLTLPHPEAHRRAFVMIPLAEMSPQWMHPVLSKTAAELAQSSYWAGWGSFFAHGKTLLDF